MAEFARDQGVLDSFRESAMLAYWRHGEDLENETVLRRAAADAGLNEDAAITASTNGRFLARIDAVREESKAMRNGLG